ncbi:argininosuccinate lyase [Tepidanaerobacter syntrophicus]|uniref:argininosuccinate lyase n=1 Tax=Tepidanaerobacter syntrophicus TaxID=224999 RepID=UPI001BD334FF|nr:argininosuccinate lyase [Tepidanaerobacter syntrophicus]GLI19788.1 argininosuccinate lyase [Tepidanaerobacter syntrophicus]
MKLWGGRFTKEADKAMERFNSSISFDKRLYKYDINGSIAHAAMLAKCGIISREDAKSIIEGLKSILDDIESGKLKISEDAEDIHTFIEQQLTCRIGTAGQRLHTARSRNDQVALDIRMYLKDAISQIQQLLISLMGTITDVAFIHIDTIMPGYTHLQRAQPVTLGHYLMAYFQMFKRDYERLGDCYKRVDIMPLGSGALATSTYPIDRHFVAEKLGFSSVSENSMDAVSDRDFEIEFLNCAALIGMHLSRFCEELVIWSSAEFNFIELDDAFCTGSSIMPQKKNPDVAELIRGKTGRLYGDLIRLFTVMKGLPLAYNKDMQEDKEAIFDAADTLTDSISIFSAMLSTATFHKDVMLKAAYGGFTNATDAADYLVKKGMPFRQAHEIIGRLVVYCIENGKDLSTISIEEYKQFSDLFDEDIKGAIDLKTCIQNRKVYGGPSRESVTVMIDNAKKFLEEHKK